MSSVADQDLAPGNLSTDLHVTGSAAYVDDLPEVEGTLHVVIATSPRAHALITRLDVERVKRAPGIRAVLTAADVAGPNSLALDGSDDPIFAEREVLHAGQALFAVVASSRRLAAQAAALAEVELTPLPALTAIEAAIAAGSLLDAPTEMQRGDPDGAMATAPYRLEGQIRCGGQEHFYLEGQVAVATPEEGDCLMVTCSSQNPAEVQRLVARALQITEAEVVVRCPRLGGGFGGKETQAALFACIAALGARRCGRPVKVRVARDQDMIMTGKRHDFVIDYQAGFAADGRVTALHMDMAVRCGHSFDLSVPVTVRALLHCDNAYFLENVRLRVRRLRTHTVSNTAFRGFGAPQAVLAIETVLDDIARHRNLEPLTVRRRNFYATAERSVTHYGMAVADNVLERLVGELAERSGYAARRAAVDQFNRRHRVLQRGLALTPVKFGISFTQTALNHASALVHVYTDGSVIVHHGGVEMGQGLETKMAQVAASELGVELRRVRCYGTHTGIIANSAPTAASASSDLNGKAVQSAARRIIRRLTGHLLERYGVPAGTVRFADGRVCFGNESMSLAALAQSAHAARVSLSAVGHYRTPKIHFDTATMRGRPFHYFVYGAAVSEVVVDTLTGEHRLERVDILQDVGRSLNQAVDRGQIEGGFLQGLGWLTSEELVWSESGELLTRGASTYKIPTSYDWPRKFRVNLVDWNENREDVIYRSKGIGEPPLLLATSVFLAIRDAVARARGDGAPLRLDAPATPERVLLALSRPPHARGA